MEQLQRMKNPGKRGYATGEARFITQVRMDQMLAGEHPYGYALNNPVTYVDPSGNQATAVIPIITAVAAADEWNPVGWCLTAGLGCWAVYELCKSRPLPPISIPWPGPSPSPSPISRPRPRPRPVWAGPTCPPPPPPKVVTDPPQPKGHYYKALGCCCYGSHTHIITYHVGPPPACLVNATRRDGTCLSNCVPGSC